MTVESYRRMLGVLLLWAILPFPFLYILMPPFWLAAAAAGLSMSLWPSAKLRPSGLMLNLIGVVIIVVVVMAGGMRIGPLRPLGHLLLLLTSVRALMVMDRRSFLRAVLLVFLVWVVAITTSTHVTVALYFVASTVLWWWVGIRVHFAGLGFERQVVSSIPRPRHVVAAAVMALLVSIPDLSRPAPHSIAVDFWPRRREQRYWVLEPCRSRRGRDDPGIAPGGDDRAVDVG